MLDWYASMSDGIHLTLAHMVLKDPVYTAWYRKRSEAGETIILDNGAYETGEPMTPLELVEAAKRVGATTVVAPDYPGQRWQKTMQAYQQFYDELPEPFKILGIPQSAHGDIAGWERCFNDMFEANRRDREPNRLSHLGMSILACPNAFREATKTKDIELNRFVATAHAREHCIAKDWLHDAQVNVHYFGFGARADLLPYYRDFGTSMDTKGPVKAAYNSLSLVGGRLPRGGQEPLDLSMEAFENSDPRQNLAYENITKLKWWMQQVRPE